MNIFVLGLVYRRAVLPNFMRVLEAIYKRPFRTGAKTNFFLILDSGSP